MKTLFILHGWAVRDGGLSKEMWQPFIDGLKPSGFEVIFLQIPGLTAPLNEVWDLDEYSSWLSAEIEKKSKDEEFVLLGHSFGGQIAVRYAGKNSEKISRLILIDSSGIKDMSLKAIFKRSIFFVIAKLGKILFRGDFFRDILYKLAREGDYKKASPLLRKTMSKILNDQVLEDLPKISCPTKIIWGENDLTTPIKHAKKMKSLVKNSELSVVKEARHSPQFTHAEETAKLVTDFII